MDHVDFALADCPSSPSDSRVRSSTCSSYARDGIIASIEDDGEDDEHELSGHSSSGPDEAVFDEPADATRHSSPHTSQHSDDEISELPSESREPSCPPQPPQSPYMPLTTRSPFRNPSSVRAIQLDTTPPHLRSGTPRYKLETPSRNSTPRSVRSHHRTRSPSKPSASKRVVREHPLVLLHATLLPVPMPYSQEILDSVLPPSVLANWKLLREKVSSTLLERGILIPHPKDDYDVLEERLLESLELKVPRILQCGHFHRRCADDDDLHAADSECDSDDDPDLCPDCGRRVRDGRFGSGTGNKRWDIKIYAANGLMRAGAWGAAWREMERVDVEILPWIEDGMRREMDLRRDEEQAARLPPSPAHTEHVPHHESRPVDEERLREIYGTGAPPFVDGFENEPPRCASPPAPAPPPFRRSRVPPSDIPLQTLLVNYIRLLLRDRRNVAILVLSGLVLVLAMGSGARPGPVPAQTQLRSTVPTAVPVPEPGAGLAQAATAAARGDGAALRHTVVEHVQALATGSVAPDAAGATDGGGELGGGAAAAAAAAVGN
jgi:hypothetical protein